MATRKVLGNNNFSGFLLFAVGFAIAGVIALALARADTIQVPIEAESSTRQGLSISSDANASGGQYVEFDEYDAETWYGYEKPGPHNTGPRNKNGSAMTEAEKQSKLTHMTGSEVKSAMAAGQKLFENVYIHGGITNPEGGDNVTFRNFVIDVQGGYYAMKNCVGAPCSKNHVFEDGEIINIGSAALISNYTARRLNVHESNSDAFKVLSDDITIESSWWHHLGKGEGAHADGIQPAANTTAKNTVVKGNFCDMPSNATPNGYGAPYKTNRCLQGMSGTMDYLFEANWLNGGNYTMSCGDGIRLVNNRFGRDYQYGIITGTCEVNQGNVWDDTGEPI